MWLLKMIQVEVEALICSKGSHIQNKTLEQKLDKEIELKLKTKNAELGGIGVTREEMRRE